MGKTWLPELEGLWRLPKKRLLQFLDGKYDSIIVLEGE